MEVGSKKGEKEQYIIGIFEIKLLTV